MLSTDTLFNIGPGGLTAGTTQLLTAGLASSSGVTLDHQTAGTLKVRNNANTADGLLNCGTITVASATAIASGVATQAALLMSSTASFGVFWGSGAPSFTATQGSLYIRSDGSSTGSRAYIAQTSNGSWTAITTAA